MASLTLDYTGDFTTKKGNVYSWDLYIVDGDSGNLPITNSTQEFIQTTWDASEGHEWSPIWASETRLTFYDTDNEDVYSDLIKNLTENLQRGARLNIKDSGGNTVWQGWANLGDLGKQEDGLGELTVTFTDGLGALEDVPFVSSTTTLNPYEGRVTFISLLATILSKTGFTLPFYVASDMYPRATSTQLLATDCPLENTYVDRYRFRNKDAQEGDIEYIDTLTVLKDVMQRWGCSIRQSGGAWHIIQNDLLYGSSYRRWYYDSNGTPTVLGGGNVYEDVNPRVTASSDTMERTPGSVSLLDPYDAVAVDYDHGLIQLLRDPGFDKSYADSVDPNPSDYRWINTGSSGVRINVASGDNSVGVVPAIYIPIGGDWPSLQGVTNSWDALVQDNLGTSGYWTTQCQNLLTAGSSLLVSAVFRPVKNLNDAQTPAGPIRRAMAQVKIYDGTSTYYLDADGAWVSPVNWIYGEADDGQTTFVIGGLAGTDALPATASVGWQVFVTLGPIVEILLYTGSGGAKYSVDSIWWDEVMVNLVLPDGTSNHERTVTTNYVGDNSAGRVNPRVFDWSVHTGDGPVAGMDASITMDAEGTDITSDWEEGAITGAASGDSMSNLQSRMILRAIRNPREVLAASYYEPPYAIGPVNTVYREGAAYAPLTLTRDWNSETYSGSWVKLRQDPFTDDLETGILGAPQPSGFGGGNGQAGFVMSQLATTFFSPVSKRVAVTSDVVSSGAQTSLPVSEISEALLDAGDNILLIAPNLDYYELVVSDNQLAGATSIAIDSYNFPEEVPYPASVFFREDDLLTLVRLGEQGFAITVKGEDVGKAAESVTATVTDLDVSDWIASIPSGSSVYIVDDNGSEQELVLTADAPKGSTNIEFASLALGVSTNAAIKANSSVSRSEFIQTATKIEQYIESEGNLLGVVTADTTGNTIYIDSLTFDLKSGDKVLVRSVDTGSVVKREVAADYSAGATAILVTPSTNVETGDIVVASQLAGLRIEMDGVQILETHLYNSGANGWDGAVDATGAITTPGTQGWIISRDGSAEFNDVTVRGKVLLAAGSSGIANFSDAGDLAVADDLDDVSDGATYAKVLSTALSSGAVLLSQASGNLDNISDGATYGKVNVTSISAGNILLAQTTGDLDDIADGTYGKVLSTSISAGKIVLAQTSGTITDVPGAGSLSAKSAVAWDTADISGIPTRLTEDDTPVGTGVYITPNYIGHYDATAATWTAFINNGNLYLKDLDGGTTFQADKADGTTLFTLGSWDFFGSTVAEVGGTNAMAFVMSSGDNDDGSDQASLVLVSAGFAGQPYINPTAPFSGIDLLGGVSTAILTTRDSDPITFRGGYWDGAADVQVTATQKLNVTATTPAYQWELSVNGNTLTFDSAGDLALPGNVTSGTWQGSVVGELYGGTDQSAYVRGDILYSDTTNSLARLAKGTDGQVLILSSGIPSWGSVDATEVTAGTLGAGFTWEGNAIDEVYGGTGQTSVLTGDLLYGSASNVWSRLANGTVGQVLMQAAGPAPAWTSLDAADIGPGTFTGDYVITGTLDVQGASISGTWQGTAIWPTRGGTNQTSWAAGDIMYSDGINSLAKLAKGTDGQVLTLVSGLPSWQAAGSGVADIDDLGDVTISGVANGEVLYYSGGWINATLSEAGIVGTGDYISATKITAGVFGAGDYTFTGDVVPAGTRSFGTSANPWSTMYADAYYLSSNTYITNLGGTTTANVYANGTYVWQFSSGGHSSLKSIDIIGGLSATSQVSFTGLPTSASGLSAGDLWNDSGTVKIA